MGAWKATDESTAGGPGVVLNLQEGGRFSTKFSSGGSTREVAGTWKTVEAEKAKLIEFQVETEKQDGKPSNRPQKPVTVEYLFKDGQLVLPNGFDGRNKLVFRRVK